MKLSPNAPKMRRSAGPSKTPWIAKSAISRSRLLPAGPPGLANVPHNEIGISAVIELLPNLFVMQPYWTPPVTAKQGAALADRVEIGYAIIAACCIATPPSWFAERAKLPGLPHARGGSNAEKFRVFHFAARKSHLHIHIDEKHF
jgi:hypothetical protein